MGGDSAETIICELGKKPKSKSDQQGTKNPTNVDMNEEEIGEINTNDELQQLRGKLL